MNSCRKAPFLSILMVLLLMYVCGVCGVTTPPPDTDTDHDGTQSRPIDQGMSPIYSMTSFFLERIINPSSITILNKKVDLRDLSVVKESIQNDWQMWLRHYYGYLICAVVAGIYALAMIVVCLVICGLRCKGKCGAKTSIMDEKNMKCKRRICVILLGVMIVLLLLGVVSLFIANQLALEKTQESGVANSFSLSLQLLDDFQSATMDSLQKDVADVFHIESDRIARDLVALPQRSQDFVGNATGVAPLINQLQTFIDSLDSTKESLESIESLSSDLMALTINLTSVITLLQNDSSMCTCNDTDCQTGFGYLNNLTVVIDLSSFNFSANDASAAIHNVSNGPKSIYSGLNGTLSAFHEVFGTIVNDTLLDIVNLTNINTALDDSIKGFVNKTQDNLMSLSFQDALQFTRDEISPWLRYAGDIRYYTSITVGVIVSLIIFLLIVALSFGTCGERATSYADCCNRGQGATLLVATAYLVMASNWLLMLGVTFLAVIGGIAHTDLCRHLVNMEPSDEVSLINDIAKYNLNTNISVTDAYMNCKDDIAFYTAANLDNLGSEYNISYILDVGTTSFTHALERMSSYNYSIGNVTLLNEDLEVALWSLHTGLSSINLSLIKSEIHTPVTSLNIADVAGFFRRASDNTNCTDMAPILNGFYEKLTNASRDYIDPIDDLKLKIASNIERVAENLAPIEITAFILHLNIAQTQIEPSVLRESVRYTSERIDGKMALLRDATESIMREDIGHCVAVYDAVTDSTNSVCIQFLYPFNGFWFSLGWILFFMIFIIPISFSLASYYQRSMKYVSKLLWHHLDFDPSATSSSSPRPNVHRDRIQVRPTEIREADTTWSEDHELQEMSLRGQPADVRTPIGSTEALTAEFSVRQTQQKHQMKGQQKNQTPQNNKKGPKSRGQSTEQLYHSRQPQKSAHRPSQRQMTNGNGAYIDGYAYDNEAYGTNRAPVPSMQAPQPRRVAVDLHHNRDTGDINGVYF